ncbi:unnamed protein product [Prorocentrum cordatum]|uniref:Peptidylprolyl isomerase n=1 Tax=Prorocentrum cordatum TaxID=2364126 RepID=A0ABN9PVP7_9DINO|nr:unnamed protein product [Polarella glacialis]
MSPYGIRIVQVLVLEARLDEQVKGAFGELVVQRNLRGASMAEAEAEAIRVVKGAEADAEKRALEGRGMALKREALAQGIVRSVFGDAGLDASSLANIASSTLVELLYTLRGPRTSTPSGTSAPGPRTPSSCTRGPRRPLRRRASCAAPGMPGWAARRPPTLGRLRGPSRRSGASPAAMAGPLRRPSLSSVGSIRSGASRRTPQRQSNMDLAAGRTTESKTSVFVSLRVQLFSPVSKAADELICAYHPYPHGSDAADANYSQQLFTNVSDAADCIYAYQLFSLSGDNVVPLVDPSTRQPTVGGLMAQAASMTTDPALKQVLHEQVTKSASPAQAQPAIAAAEAVRRAEGVWKLASLQCEQASAHVQRCRDSLDTDKAREAEAIRALATVELSRKVAAKAMAREVGVVECTSPSPPSGGSGATFIDLQWDAALLEELDSLECTEVERLKLKQFEAELQAAKSNFSAEAEEINQWKAPVTEIKQKIEERTQKKRKVGSETAAAGDAPSSSPAAPVPAGPSQEEIDAEVGRIRGAREAGAAAAAQAADAPAGEPGESAAAAPDEVEGRECNMFFANITVRGKRSWACLNSSEPAPRGRAAKLHYKGMRFHRIILGFVCQAAGGIPAV